MQDDESSLEDILDENEQKFLDILKDRLKSLKVINHRFARAVVAVSGFYNSLLDKISQTESNGYENVVKNISSFNMKA